MKHVHELAHRKDINGLVAAVRRHAWILQARALAKQVAKSCAKCRLQARDTKQQIMADLPGETLRQCAPFQAVGMDFFGPLMVKGIGGQCRKCFKVWGVLYVCLATKAVAIWMTDSYATPSFLLCHRRQVDVYGSPSLRVTD